MYRVAFDYDGVITANWQHYTQLAYDFHKSGFSIYIITAAKYDRAREIEIFLHDMKFPVDVFVSRPINFKSNNKNIGEWKKQNLQAYSIDLFFDNEIKQYEQAGVDFSDLKTAIVRV